MGFDKARNQYYQNFATVGPYFFWILIFCPMPKQAKVGFKLPGKESLFLVFFFLISEMSKNKFKFSNYLLSPNKPVSKI